MIPYGNCADDNQTRSNAFERSRTSNGAYAGKRVPRREKRISLFISNCALFELKNQAIEYFLTFFSFFISIAIKIHDVFGRRRRGLRFEEGRLSGGFHRRSYLSYISLCTATKSRRSIVKPTYAVAARAILETLNEKISTRK